MYINLTHIIDPTKPVVGTGVDSPKIIPRSRKANGDRNNTSYIYMFAHYGTHIDSPWHFNEYGKKIADIPISDYVFKSVLLVDLPKEPWENIDISDLEPYRDIISESDAILIRTGFEKFRESDSTTYIESSPSLNENCAHFLSSFKNLRCIGVDFISIENIKKNRERNYPIHNILLGRDEPIILLEDAKLSPLGNNEISTLFLFPLFAEKIEASPVTAVAEVL